MSRYGIQFFVLLALVVTFQCFPALSRGQSLQDGQERTVTAKHILVIGKVTDNPKKHYNVLKSMADYAAAKMNDLGITGVQVLMAKNNRQMIEYLRQGKVDWVTDTVFSALIYEKYAGAEILLRKWKKGQSEYHTVFFTRKDSTIDAISDLAGKTIAFEDPGSTSAYFIPATLLMANGMRLERLETPREHPSASMVGYAFSNQEINTLAWVYRGIVDAGVLSNIDWNKTDQIIDTYKQEMKIILRTETFPRAVEIVRADLDPDIKARLREILLSVHDDPAGREALWAYQKTRKFDELDRQSLAAIASARVKLNEFYPDLK